ncbi:hypothetical protein C2S52_017725 [Perilla frutescens var. hirtella]|nr:hypothetical protein C2S52_017725 [Perilla frutescens var. hirtella]KAH6811518.1 hypothetical protein C2S51_025280 [Perilla frutescens var. frutescens]
MRSFSISPDSGPAASLQRHQKWVRFRFYYIEFSAIHVCEVLRLRARAEVFDEMPSRDTISTCVRSGNWRLGRAMHALFFVEERMVFSTFMETSLVDFYWKFGDPDMAFRVFDGMVEV